MSMVSVPSAKDMAQLRERIFRSVSGRIPGRKEGIILYYRAESQLVNFEYQVGVKQRWKKTDKDYIAAQHATLLNRKEALHSSLRAAVVRWHYLLNLKAKYAGQRIYPI